MGQPIYVVDAFTDRAFAGNPGAVCPLGQPRDLTWMQAVAREMNLAATAFVHRTGESWSLRWFSPQAELDLCGHGTLACAQVLWETEAIPADRPAAFDTRGGRLTASRKGPWIELNFPAEHAVLHGNPGNLLGALNATGIVVGHKRNRLDYLVELANEEAVRCLKPNFALLATLPVRGVIVTARSDNPEFDFVSRFFAPSLGISEDAVTGSAHCCLAPYWGAKLGKRQLVGYQASARSGTVRTTLADDRVLLSGQAVTVLRGELVAS